jgi:phosphoribosylformylglycinamidine synthase subunit PurQ / glutaminase
VKPQIIILHAPGTNRDRDVAWACELAGGSPEIVTVRQLLAGTRSLPDYKMLVVPGGFSYGDDLGAGRVWATQLRHDLGDALDAFVASGRPAIGICNGFQVLVKTGLLPAGQTGPQRATLTRNDSGHFECRWVWLEPNPKSPCIFTRDLDAPIHCPVAHGEGKFVAADDAEHDAIEAQGLVALRYTDPEGNSAGYPWNPNGSRGSIAGICNPQGNVLGLMPHPEDHIKPEQHPGWHRGERGNLGLGLFQAGVRYASTL